MPTHFVLVGVTCLVLATPTWAAETAQPPSEAPTPTEAEPAEPRSALSDVVYKGIVGKALDAVPMDPKERVALQQTNAVVSNTLAGRSISVWAGLANPVLLVAGLAWGLFSASNIKAADAKLHTNRVKPVEPRQAPIAALSAPPENVAAAETR